MVHGNKLVTRVASAVLVMAASLVPSSALDDARGSGRGSPASLAAPVVVVLAAAGSYASELETAVLDELNLARTQPAVYAGYLREYRKLISGNYLKRPGKITIVLNEGVSAVDSAIKFLEKQAPLAPLSMAQGLWRAASDHARDQSKSGKTGHTGSDGSTMQSRIERYGSWDVTIGENIDYGGETARDIVINLIVDDGVPSRGHRKNIFNADFKVVGIAVAPHPGYGLVCVQDFAGAFK